MLTLRQREAKRAQKQHKNKRTNWFFRLNAVAVVLTIASAFYVFVSFSDIIIGIKCLLLSAAIFCLAVLLFFSKRNYYIMYFWFLGIGALLFMNDAFADKTTFTVKRPIEAKYFRNRKSGPFAEITYKRVSLHIHCDTEKTLTDSHYAVLRLSRGFLGLDVIRDRKLVKD
jgi:uncharacterized membrane protein YgcG